MRSQLLGLASVLLLSACSTSLQGVSDAYHFWRSSSAQSTRDAAAALDPKVAWLRITIHGHSTVMALGYIEPNPRGAIEVWYGAGAEVLRLQNGHTVDTAGLPTDWSSVRFSALPAWRDVKAPVMYTRSRDVTPGYDFGITDTLTLAPIAPPSSSDVKGVAPDSLAWFSEVSQGLKPLPPARYAVSMQEGKSVVVYGEQCLSPAFCLSWQRLPFGAPEQSHAK